MTAMDASSGGSPRVQTEVLYVDPLQISGTDLKFSESLSEQDWELKIDPTSQYAANLQRAARELRESDTPVAFPTETVYGLGADVTRSSAVSGIFEAKQRPSDNPLIVHVCSLQQLRNILNPTTDISDQCRHRDPNSDSVGSSRNGIMNGDPIPEIYRPLIHKFWPGPLSLIMPVPKKASILAPEVTAGLNTFGARMPRNPVALALIKMAGVPLAAPSANASTKPSTTTAAHVNRDLNGRISTIINGGPCDVGVESTVVDGLSNPPTVLRPGGISLEQLRACPGWEHVQLAYKDKSEQSSIPKAPGMKYKHYSPTAKVILYEYTESQPSLESLGSIGKSIGIIRTQNWKSIVPVINGVSTNGTDILDEKTIPLEGVSADFKSKEPATKNDVNSVPKALKLHCVANSENLEIWDINLGSNVENIARGLFSALREFDEEHVDAIVVEGISDKLGDVAAAIMNRLRKAAETQIGTVE